MANIFQVRHFGLLLVIVGCSVGQREVKYSEMLMEPKITLDEQRVFIETANSKENSALSIYKIEPTIDKKNNSVLLRGLHAAGKPYQTRFEIALKNTTYQQLMQYTFYWVDPDGRKTRLDVEER